MTDIQLFTQQMIQKICFNRKVYDLECMQRIIHKFLYLDTSNVEFKSLIICSVADYIHIKYTENHEEENLPARSET